MIDGGSVLPRRVASRLIFAGWRFPVVKDLASEELKDPFSRAMKRALEPTDVWARWRLWPMRILALAGLIYGFSLMPTPEGVALSVASIIVLSIYEQLRRLSDRVERLEVDAMLRDLSSGSAGKNSQESPH
jgi:hypothetical protein